jgi:uncharacterized protein YodC (DUF2158 family)
MTAGSQRFKICFDLLFCLTKARITPGFGCFNSTEQDILITRNSNRHMPLSSVIKDYNRTAKLRHKIYTFAARRKLTISSTRMKPTYGEIFKSYQTMGSWASSLLKWLIGPQSKFKENDAVQETTGGPLMVVVKVFSSRKLKEPMLLCQWSDPINTSKRTQLFHHHKLKAFDWYEALKNKDEHDNCSLPQS